MSPTIAQTVGVDISKDTLDVHRHPDGTARRFLNNAKGFAALIQWLQNTAVTRVVFEPTGAYHHAFERSLGAAGLPLVKVNPLQARRFAQAIGPGGFEDSAPRPMRSMPPCSHASARSSSRRRGLSSARPWMP